MSPKHVNVDLLFNAGPQTKEILLSDGTIEELFPR
jgi:hypothetical protein